MLRAFGNDLGFVPVVYGSSGATSSAWPTVALGVNAGIRGIRRPAVTGPLVQFMLGASGDSRVRHGRWWTVPPWPHGGVLHILFNTRPAARLHGRNLRSRPDDHHLYRGWRVGFTLSSLGGSFADDADPVPEGAPLTVGASASIRSPGALAWRRGGSIVRSEALGYAVTLGIMGFILPGVDNYAHGGGFLGGYLAGVWLDPLKPERMDHFFGAAICLVLTALAILVSVLTGYVLLS
jgi:rhomboid protease GluP